MAATIDSLLNPLVVALDEDGVALYANMRSAEGVVLTRMHALGAYVVECHGEDVEPNRDFYNNRRRKLALVPRNALDDIHENWPHFLEMLRPSRIEFQRYLDTHKEPVHGRAGLRSTALPSWIGYDQDVKKLLFASAVTYRSSAAYRAGVLSFNDVSVYFKSQMLRAEEVRSNALAARQKERAQVCEDRLDSLKKDFLAFSELDTDVIARVRSGDGMKFRAKFEGRPSRAFGVPGLTVICSESIEPARKRNFPSRYGEPILVIESLNLEIYKKT